MSANLSTKLYCGKLVRLAALDMQKDTELWARWNQDSEFQQLSDWAPARVFSTKQIRDWMEKNIDTLYSFSIQTLADGKTIGQVDLSGVNWTAGDAWLGVGIGEREYWGKGYGSEAVNLILRFGFEQLNLRRVSLNVFEYNERAIRSYHKLGFKIEGRQRQFLNRFDRRWDVIYMGILRSEWEACQEEPSQE